jgi:hypothetical protein
MYILVCIYIISYARLMPKMLIPLALLLSIAIGVPVVERWIKCLSPESEGCVWAKAYMPLSFALWTIVGVLVAAVAWYLLGRARR